MEQKQDKSNEAQTGQLRQARVSGSAIYRPADTVDLCEALASGIECEVPNRYIVKAFGAMDYHHLKGTIEEGRETDGWTVISPHCR